MDKCIRNSCNNQFRSQRRTANSNSNTCNNLKKRFQQVEFAIVEVVLYLDAYPECTEALNYYHRLIDERTTLLEEINNLCGPMTSYDNISHESWQWTNGPWPWMYEAN